MPVKRPAGLGNLQQPTPQQTNSGDSVKITDTLSLMVKDADGKMIRVTGEGLAAQQQQPQATAPAPAPTSSKPKVEALMDKILFEDLKILDVLGAGAQGKVRKVQHRKTGELYALKSIAFSEDKDATRDVLRAELKRLAALKHPNVVSSYEAYFRDGKLYIVLELMDCGTLNSVTKANPNGIPEKAASYIAQQFCIGLKHLHEHGVIHRDLKPANLLINSKGDVKISDFGVAKEFGNQGASQQTLAPVGSTPYMSPERIKGLPYSFGCDIWSLGLTIAEITIGQYPFENLKGNTFALTQAIVNGTVKVGWDLMKDGKKPSADLVDFVNECMKPVEARPSAEKLLAHPFIKLCSGTSAGAFGKWFQTPAKTVEEAEGEFKANPPLSSLTPSTNNSQPFTPGSAMSAEGRTTSKDDEADRVPEKTCPKKKDEEPDKIPEKK